MSNKDYANQSIHCSVQNCAYHAGSQNYCSLNEIKVGSCEQHPTETKGTECDSFKDGTGGATTAF